MTITNVAIPTPNPVFSAVTHSRPSVNHINSTILSAKPNRLFAIIENNTAATIYINLGSTAVVNQGVALEPNTKYEITTDNLWIGYVTAIKGTTTSSNMDVIEGT